MLAKRIISNREIPATSLPLLLLSRTRIIFSSQFQSQRLLQQQQQLDKQRFFSTTVMRRQLVQLELFTKENCGLCDNAKLVMENVLAKEHSNEVQLKYTDITLPQNKLWWDSYCFDVPVLHITQEGQTKPIKFMHRLDEKKIIEAINKNNIDSPKKL